MVSIVHVYLMCVPSDNLCFKHILSTHRAGVSLPRSLATDDTRGRNSPTLPAASPHDDTLNTIQKFLFNKIFIQEVCCLLLPDSGAAPPRSHSQVTLRSRRPLPQVTEHWKYFWIRPELFLLVHEISQEYFKGF